MDPLVSVLIPAYNAERYLGAALESILAQTYSNLEVIVVDDGSADATLSVARAFESRGVRVVEQGENRGQTAALNRALSEATGEYIQYFDADDLLEPAKIEVQVRRLEQEPPGTLATSVWARFYENDLATASFTPSPDYRDYDVPTDWLIDDWTGNGTMPPGAWLYPRGIVEAVGPWHEGLTLNNDMEYFTRAILAAEKIAHCPNARWYYRSGHDSLSRRRSRAALESQFEVIRLSTERLLSRVGDARARHAAACYWQSFLYMAYPDAPDLVQTAEREVAQLGGGSILPGGGPLFEKLRDATGWKLAVRLQKWYYGLRQSVDRVVA